MNEIKYASTISADYLDELKSLLFFNPEQHKIVNGILSSIEKYGIPLISSENNILRIKIGDLSDVQTIYAFDSSIKPSQLVGVMIYYRETIENIVLLHIAVKDEYTLSSSDGRSIITLELIDRLKKIAGQIKGVTYISIYYHKDKLGKIKIK